MCDGVMLMIDDDGVAHRYDDTFDITIHCESQEEQDKVIRMLQGMEWIPVSERLPEYGHGVLTYLENGDYEINHIVDDETGEWFYDEVVAWCELLEPYREAEK